MKHPLSTIFNITYFIAFVVGIIGAFQNSLFMQGLAAAAVLFMAVASTGYHWTETRRWQHADIIGIYAAFFLLMAWQLSTMPTFDGYDVLLIIVFAGLAVAMAFTYDDWSHTQIGMLGIINLAFLWPRAGTWIFIAATVCFLGGLAIGQWAEKFPKDTPDYDWRHALWKIPTAAGILLLLLNY